MNRVVLAVITGVVVFAAAYASAMGFNLAPSGLGSGADDVIACDDSFTYGFSLNEDRVESVTVGDIAAACGEGDLKLTLANKLEDPVGSSATAVPTGGGSVTLVLETQPSIDDVFHKHVIIIGP